MTKLYFCYIEWDDDELGAYPLAPEVVMKANLPLAIEEINPSGIRRKLQAVQSRIKLGSKSIDIEARPEGRVICDLTKRATDYDIFAFGIYSKMKCEL
jgi:hypothetical protein